MEKIVELIQEKKYDKLKLVLETILAKKIKGKIDEKKVDFVEKMKATKSGG